MNIPGRIYLCQVSKAVSCGACCGLYNLPDLSYESLFNILTERTCEFSSISRQTEQIVGFGERIIKKVLKNPPFPEFYHCPYVGLVGNDLGRIGCLLHPLAQGNNGIDFRGLSYYGGMACRIYFCPSYRLIPERYKAIARAAFNHWYAYGLVITEWKFINACFQELEKLVETRLSLKMISDKTLSALYNLLSIKLNWPFRSPQWHVTHYFFEDQLYRPPEIQYLKTGSQVSRYHDILYSLGSCFPSHHALHRAEDILNSHFNIIAESILKTR